MAVTNYSNQFKYTGAGYIDAKIQPVATVADLNSIPRNQRFLGLTVTVLNDPDGNQRDYWLRTSLTAWEPKDGVVVEKIAELEARLDEDEKVHVITGDDLTE